MAIFWVTIQASMKYKRSASKRNSGKKYGGSCVRMNDSAVLNSIFFDKIILIMDRGNSRT